MVNKINGAHNWTRTSDLFLTKEVLYRLSYVGVKQLFFPNLERVMGIEPTQSAWKAEVLPLNYTRLSYRKYWWRGKDSNLRRQSRQIYSLIPLTAREPLQKERHFL